MLKLLVSFITILSIVFTNFGQNPTQDEPVLSMRQILINVNVSVIDDKTRTIPNLSEDNFELYCQEYDKAKIKQEITFFDKGSAPITMGIIFDISGSMEPSKYQIARLALKNLFDENRKGDQYFLILFDKTASLIQFVDDKTKEKFSFTNNKNIIISGVPTATPRQSTAFYDGIQLGIDAVNPSHEVYKTLSRSDQDAIDKSKNQRKVLVVISDGQDNSSRWTEKEIRENLKEKDTVIYSITITDPERGTSYAHRGETLMEDIAHKTGGLNFIPEAPDQITEACSRIRRLISHQYVLGFYYAGPYDGKFKKIEIKLRPPKGLPKLSAKHREGFNAPPPIKKDPDNANKKDDGKSQDPSSKSP